MPSMPWTKQRLSSKHCWTKTRTWNNKQWMKSQRMSRNWREYLRRNQGHIRKQSMQDLWQTINVAHLPECQSQAATRWKGLCRFRTRRPLSGTGLQAALEHYYYRFNWLCKIGKSYEISRRWSSPNPNPNPMKLQPALTSPKDPRSLEPWQIAPLRWFEPYYLQQALPLFG